MHPFQAKRAYLLLTDEATDELIAETKPRWKACFYLLAGTQFLAPIAVVLLSAPFLFQLPLGLRLAAGLLAIAFLWRGPLWLDRWLQPLRIASIRSAVLRHLATTGTR